MTIEFRKTDPNERSMRKIAEGIRPESTGRRAATARATMTICSTRRVGHDGRALDDDAGRRQSVQSLKQHRPRHPAITHQSKPAAFTSRKISTAASSPSSPPRRSSSPKAAPYDGGRFQVAETTAGIARSWPCSPGTSGRSRHRSEPSASSRSDHAPRVPKKRPLSTPRQSGGRLAPIGAGGVSVLLRFRAVPVSDRRRALP